MNLFIVISFLVMLASVVMCHQVAKRRGANTTFWVLMAASFGPFAVPFVFLSKPKKSLLNEK